MSRGIFLVHSEDTLVEMREERYDTEDRLQVLLERYPNLLAGDQIDPTNPRRWLLVAREAAIADQAGGTGRWYADHLLLDQDSTPTIVEVKRSTDTRIRREVVGQILDYAANIIRTWPPDDLLHVFRDTCSDRGLNPDEVVRAAFGPTFDVEKLWRDAKENLRAGNIRLVFVADIIPEELKTVVEFLNKQMAPAEVLAVEIRQYRAEGFQTLVPTVFGRTAEAQQRKGLVAGDTAPWDETRFFEALLDRDGSRSVDAAKKLLSWSRTNATRVWWGRGTQSGSFVPVLRHRDIDHQLFAVYTYGTCEVQFQYFSRRVPFDSIELRRELRDRLNRISGIQIEEDALTRRPPIPLSVLGAGNNVDLFLDAYSWVIQTIKAS